MKSNEFRIGNIVFATPEVTREKGISVIDVNILLLIEQESEEYRVEGIPINEEWLIKLGFEKGSVTEGAMETEYYLESNFYVWFGKDGKIDFSYDLGYGEMNRIIKFVHQLQNLYFALTGNELI